MEHIAAEKGSVTEMVQKVRKQCYLEEFDLVFELSDSDDRWLLELYWGWLLLGSDKPLLTHYSKEEEFSQLYLSQIEEQTC